MQPHVAAHGKWRGGIPRTGGVPSLYERAVHIGWNWEGNKGVWNQRQQRAWHGIAWHGMDSVCDSIPLSEQVGIRAPCEATAEATAHPVQF